MELEIKNITKKFKDKTAVNNFNVTLFEGIYGLLGPNGSGKTTLMRMIADVVKPTEGIIMINGRNRKIKGFSEGMKERLGIAQALLNDPKILILDEPTAGLDPNERIRFKNMIARLSKDKIVILSTHIVSDVEFLANEIVIMKQGSLVEKNTTSGITDKMRGKVWSLIVDEQKYGDIMDKYKISKTSMDNGFVTVRIVSDEKPAASAVEQKPTLEDMFLYYFGEVAEKLR
ncbi:ATP-binding cassette domain-containing protein [Inconstantimicrobium porci]|uniref:ATP-binding cassette domain-containing protein n=1 Tax=Inconstantimicrobium porci TaxID=2652291 RepID=A0A7X2MYS6_9CLOT|nr:ATP-binding cassette domain-containing protein [Inconstantimicrobium porci]MSR91581.1 ATP-binding cassette domain-containing protein [Inconstantimicrobium porci]